MRERNPKTTVQSRTRTFTVILVHGEDKISNHLNINQMDAYSQFNHKSIYGNNLVAITTARKIKNKKGMKRKRIKCLIHEIIF